MSELRPGLSADTTRIVTEADTAVELGSGDVPVLATPRLLAWLEAATVAAVADAVTPEQTSVGTRVEFQHEIASAVGERVQVHAALTAVDGRLLRFAVAAEDASGRRIASGEVTRAVVERERFLARLQRPSV